jgi:hypothetical protein
MSRVIQVAVLKNLVHRQPFSGVGRAFCCHWSLDMESPVHIDFQGMNPSELLRDRVLKHVARLEQRFGRITACRVTIKAPSEHHHSGGPYAINIRLSLPQGREVDVGRTATSDERHADPDFAVNDAFKRAQRRLQTNAAGCADR